MNLTDFHFAQPLWLWGLLLIPAGIAWFLYCRRRTRQGTIGGLDKFADKTLLQHLLLNSYKTKHGMMLGWLFALVITLVVIALANPRWQYEEIEAFTPSASMVVLLDLGEQMSARDVAPSRVIRARQYIEDLVNASRGLKIGLIGFAANPHLISPITDDLQTIKNYLPALDTFLISKQGDNLSSALRMATELLSQEPGVKKSILLISDGNFVDNDFTDQIANLTKNGVTIHVLGIGTVSGAPFSDQAGRMKHAKTGLAISKLNQPVLKVIAKRGNGIYVESNMAGQGINAILNKAQHIESKDPLVSGKIRQWEDSYYWFLIPAVLLLGFLLTQRALYVVTIALVFGMTQTNDVYALELFKNSDQAAQQQFELTNFAEAAVTFKDPYRKGVALYRAGDYAAAEQQFNASERAEVKVAALYNAGNAQMQQKKWRAAIRSYEQVLKIQEDHDDAIFNLALAKKMLEKDDCDCDNPDNKNKDKQGDGDKNKDSKGTGEDKQDKSGDNKSDDSKQDQNSDKDKSDASNNSQNSNDASQDNQDSNADTQQQDAQNAQQDSAKSKAEQKKLDQQEARAQQWLNRINSDIRVFLQNKFYLEDVVNKR